MSHGPNIKSAGARCVDENVRVDFRFPVGTDDTWGWSATMDPDEADKLAEQLHGAAHVARVLKQKSQQATDRGSGG